MAWRALPYPMQGAMLIVFCLCIRPHRGPYVCVLFSRGGARAACGAGARGELMMSARLDLAFSNCFSTDKWSKNRRRRVYIFLSFPLVSASARASASAVRCTQVHSLLRCLWGGGDLKLLFPFRARKKTQQSTTTPWTPRRVSTPGFRFYPARGTPPPRPAPPSAARARGTPPSPSASSSCSSARP